MNGANELVKMFGDVTVSRIISILIVIGFCYMVYKRVKEYFNAMFESEKTRTEHEAEQDKKLEVTLEAVNNLPGYRKQSLEIQKQFSDQIKKLEEKQNELMDKLIQMEDDIKRRERNKSREELLRAYRFYTNPEKNPTLSWNKMEAASFWERVSDYEKDGGNDYIHSIVKPAMNMLTVVDIEEHHIV